MSWFKVDDDAHGHPKQILAGPDAVGLWMMAGSWSAKYLTNGFIPEAALPTIAFYTPERAERLLTPPPGFRFGLWEPATGGVQIHDFLQYNPSREQVMADREREKAKKAARRGNPPGNPRPNDSGLPVGKPGSGIYSTDPGEKGEDRGVGKGGVVLPDWLPAALWTQWREHKRSIGHPMSTHAEKLNLGTLAKLRTEGHDPRECIELAIERGWRGLFAPRARQPEEAVEHETSAADVVRRYQEGR